MHYSSLGSTAAYTSLQYATKLKFKTTTISPNTVDSVKFTVCSASVSHGQNSAAAVGQLTLLSALFVQVPRETTYLFVHTAVWLKVDGVQFSEMRYGLKMVSPPGFLCNTDKEIQCILICF